MGVEAPTLPYTGAVIRYGYLWRDEALRSRDGGRKDRPCVILATAAVDDGVVVYVAPITRTSHGTDDAIELSRPVRRRLRLDTDNPSWLVTNEANRFRWRGTDVVPVAPGIEHYGRLDDKIVKAAQRRFLDSIRQGESPATTRT